MGRPGPERLISGGARSCGASRGGGGAARGVGRARERIDRKPAFQIESRKYNGSGPARRRPRIPPLPPDPRPAHHAAPHLAAAAGRRLRQGDAEVLARLPGVIDPSRIALAGLHDWVADAHAHVAQWGIASFGPEDLRQDSAPLLDWFRSTGARRLAIHFDVDTIDSREVPLGFGLIPGGLSAAQAHRLLADLGQAGDVVGLTIAEFFPRELLALGTVLAGLPLIGG